VFEWVPSCWPSDHGPDDTADTSAGATPAGGPDAGPKVGAWRLLDLLDRYVGQPRKESGTETSNALWEQGLRLGFETAVAEALAV